MASGRREAAERRVVVALLRGGLAIGAALMLVGVGLALGKGRLTSHPVPLRSVWPWILDGRPSGFLAGGVLVLVATPLLRIVGLVAIFALNHDWRFAAVAATVAAILALGIALGRV